jgi:hypothetical protein
MRGKYLVVDEELSLHEGVGAVGSHVEQSIQ